MRALAKQTTIELAAPAIIMAYGIFFIGAYDYLPFLWPFEWVTIPLFTVMVASIFTMVFVTYILPNTFKQVQNEPTRLFALGTWVAGMTVFLLVLQKHNLLIQPFKTGLAFMNGMLVIGLIGLYTYAFKQLLKRPSSKVDGIILLSTVSLQSIVIMLFHLFCSTFKGIFIPLICLGLICYIIGSTLIGRSYLKKGWTFADDWANTNCIIHGALSITGLAVVLTESFSHSFIFTLFIITTLLLCLVECLEILRLFKRIKRYHMRDGIFNYHVTQWSRNFTFGMYFTFVFTMKENGLFNFSPSLDTFVNAFLHLWAYVVFFLLVFETGLLIHSKIILFNKQKRSSTNDH